MAIQNRRGKYSDFDPEKMVPGEWATVLSGDPNAGDGKSIYHCFSAGNVKRMATYEDMEDNINKATDDIRNEFLEDINNATQSANTAATSANQAAQTAQKAAQDAQNAAESIEGAVEGTIINDQTPSNVTAFSGKYVDDTFLKKTGDATNTTVKFAPPDKEQDLVSGETSGTLFGKIVKKLSVIKAAIGTLSSLTTTNKSSLVGAVNELNSALVDIETTNLKRYYYQGPSGTWKSFNMVLPADVSTYAYLPFLVVIGSGIYALNVNGGAAGSSLTETGITIARIIGSEITVNSIKEGSRVRIKFMVSETTNAPVSVVCLRQGITIADVNFAQS